MVKTRASKRANLESCQNAGDMLKAVNRTQFAPPSEIIGGKKFNTASVCSTMSTKYFTRTYSRRHSKSSIKQNTKVRTYLEWQYQVRFHKFQSCQYTLDSRLTFCVTAAAMDCVQVIVCLDSILGIVILLLILILSVVCRQGPGSRERVSATSDTSRSESNSDDGDCSVEQSSTDTSMTGVEMTEGFQIYELKAEFYDGMGKDELHNLENYVDQSRKSNQINNPKFTDGAGRHRLQWMIVTSTSLTLYTHDNSVSCTSLPVLPHSRANTDLERSPELLLGVVLATHVIHPSEEHHRASLLTALECKQ